MDGSAAILSGHTLREIDAAGGRPKGSAFRVFKSLPLQEGVDFWVFHPETSVFAELQTAGRLYPGALRAIVVSAEARRRIEHALMSGSAPPDR